jgi:hypothetical protein
METSRDLEKPHNLFVIQTVEITASQLHQFQCHFRKSSQAAKLAWIEALSTRHWLIIFLAAAGVHGVRYVSELGYREFITQTLPQNEYIGDQVQRKLIYVPTVTREPFERQGRVTELLEQGQLTAPFNLPEICPKFDRVMICGNPSLLTDLVEILERRGFDEGSMNSPGTYVIERAFVEK